MPMTLPELEMEWNKIILRVRALEKTSKDREETFVIMEQIIATEYSHLIAGPVGTTRDETLHAIALPEVGV